MALAHFWWWIKIWWWSWIRNSERRPENTGSWWATRERVMGGNITRKPCPVWASKNKVGAIASDVEVNLTLPSYTAPKNLRLNNSRLARPYIWRFNMAYSRHTLTVVLLKKPLKIKDILTRLKMLSENWHTTRSEVNWTCSCDELTPILF